MLVQPTSIGVRTHPCLPCLLYCTQALSSAVATGGNATATALSQALAQAAGSGAGTQAIANALAQVRSSERGCQCAWGLPVMSNVYV
jgi:hypothetical protein